MNCSEGPEPEPHYQSSDLDRRVREVVLADAESMNTAALEARVMRLVMVEQTKARRRFWGRALAGALATAAAVAAALFYQPAGPSPLYTAAARDHRLEVVDHLPRKWRADVAEARALAASRGIPGAALDRISEAGYTFKEAKLCRLDGLVFLHVVYTGSGREFSLFLRQEDGGAGNNHEPVHTFRLGSQHIAGCTEGQLRALVVTEESGDTALRIAQTATRAV